MASASNPADQSSGASTRRPTRLSPIILAGTGAPQGTQEAVSSDSRRDEWDEARNSGGGPSPSTTTTSKPIIPPPSRRIARPGDGFVAEKPPHGSVRGWAGKPDRTCTPHS